MILNILGIHKAMNNGMSGAEVVRQVDIQRKKEKNHNIKNGGADLDKLFDRIFQDIYKRNPIEVEPRGLTLNKLFKKITIMEAKNA